MPVKDFVKLALFDEVSTKACFLTFLDHPICNKCILSALPLVKISLREDFKWVLFTTLLTLFLYSAYLN